MVEISLSGSGEGSGWVTAPGYSTAAFSAMSDKSVYDQQAQRRQNLEVNSKAAIWKSTARSFSTVMRGGRTLRIEEKPPLSLTGQRLLELQHSVC